VGPGRQTEEKAKEMARGGRFSTRAGWLRGPDGLLGWLGKKKERACPIEKKKKTAGEKKKEEGSGHFKNYCT